MTRKIIAVDIDDVMSHSAEWFVEYLNRTRGIALAIEDYQDDWTKMLSIELDEMRAMMRDIFTSGDFVRSAKPNIDALHVLQKLAKNYDIISVTSRSSLGLDDTRDWLDQNFPGIFADLHFLDMWNREKNGPDSSMLHVSKGDICQELGAHYLIDDQPKHCNGAAECGVKTVLFGNYAWNRDAEIVDGVVRAKTWNDVAKYFDKEEI